MESFRQQVESIRPTPKTTEQVNAENLCRISALAECAEAFIKDAVLREAQRTYQGKRLKVNMALNMYLPHIGCLEIALNRGQYMEGMNQNNRSPLVDIKDTSKRRMFSTVSTQHICLTSTARAVRNALIDRLSDSGFSFGEWMVSPIPNNYYDDSYSSPNEPPFVGVTPIDKCTLFHLPVTVLHSSSDSSLLTFKTEDMRKGESIRCWQAQLLLPFTYE